MLHVLRSEVFIRGEEGGRLGPLFLNFLDPPLQIKAFLSAAVRNGQFKIWLSLYTVGVKIVQIFCTNDKEKIIFQRIFMIEYFIFQPGR